MLNITVENVIRSVCKDYIDTLPEDTATEYVNRLKTAISSEIQSQIDQLESWCSSIQVTAENTISSAATWAVQIPAIATPEPAAPKTGAAALVSLKNSVAQAKAQINMASSQLDEVVGTIENWRITLPAAISTLHNLINTCKNALNAIPT